MTYLLGGVVGANLIGIVLVRTRAYKVLSCIIPISTIVTISIFYFTLGTETFAFTLFEIQSHLYKP